MKKEQTPEKTVEKVEKPEKAEPVFTAAQLRPDCRTLFGVSASTYDGATASLDGEYTVAWMRSHIDKWLKEVY